MSILLPAWTTKTKNLDPRYEQFARLSIALIIILVIGVTIWIPIGISIFSDPLSERFVYISALTIYITCAIAYACLWKARVQSSMLVLASGISIAVSLVLCITGLVQSGAVLLVYSLPMIVAGLTWGRRGLIVFGLLIVLFIAGLTYTHQLPNIFWRDSLDSPVAIVLTFALALFLINSFLDQFHSNLRSMLQKALQQEANLNELRDSLEQIVEERTSTLSAALTDMQAREQTLKQTLDELERTQQAVEALSAPILPILPRVLVLPLIGTITQERLKLVRQSVLAATHKRKARLVILDLTGLSMLDTKLALGLIETSKAARLLGAQVALVGIQPKLAHTLTALEIDFHDLQIYADLASAIESMLSGTTQQKPISLLQATSVSRTRPDPTRMEKL